MARREAKRVYRELTPEEHVRLANARKETAAEKSQILARGRHYKQLRDQMTTSLKEACRLLKAERDAQGLSLAEMEERTGIAKSALSRLENETEANPTIATLARYADALGKKLMIALADAS